MTINSAKLAKKDLHRHGETAQRHVWGKPFSDAGHLPKDSCHATTRDDQQTAMITVAYPSLRLSRMLG